MQSFVDQRGLHIQSKFLDFLKNSQTCQQSIQSMIEQSKVMFSINYQELQQYDQNLLNIVIQENYRLQNNFNKALQELVLSMGGEKNNYFIGFYNLNEVFQLRNLRSSDIGKLISVSGTVTRSSEIRPEILQACFRCQECSTLISIDQQFQFTTPKKCLNTQCQNASNFILVEQKSLYVDWQKVKIQENSSEIPPGSMPLSFDVILRQDLVGKVKPGDSIICTGNLIVVPQVVSLLKPGEVGQAYSYVQNRANLDSVSGLKQLGVRDLSYKFQFLACDVKIKDLKQQQNLGSNQNEDIILEEEPQFTEEEKRLIQQMSQQSDIYKRLARSICPSVFGHEEVKKGVLLLLVGGVNKKTQDKTKLRGDINICLVGDPSTAKSQFLKYVSEFSPRSVYTSGKASTAAGLTASVIRDKETGEFTIEAGALLLSDQGICCIDEFDKMDKKDQVAIHEAMEQQTISLAKAGVYATLNARASILAAANPIFGRYDKTRTLKYNVNISPPIMSRFDLFYVILDDCNQEIDRKIAEHIVNLDIFESSDLYSMQQMQVYIRYTRTLKPKLSQEAGNLLKESYARIRQNEGSTAYRITSRQLESLIRLSEALARIHCSSIVKEEFVREAVRLLQSSIITVEQPSIDLEEFQNNIPSQKQPNKQQQVQSVSYAEYKKITREIAAYLRYENPEGCYDDDLVAHFMLKQSEQVTISEEEIQDLEYKIKKIIEKLIEQEGILIVMSQQKKRKFL